MADCYVVRYFLISLFFFLSSCVSLSYSFLGRSYVSHLPQDKEGLKEWTSTYKPLFLKESERSKIIRVSNINQSLMEYQMNHYVVLGFSEIVSHIISDFRLSRFAKKLGATVVLREKKYKNSTAVGGGGSVVETSPSGFVKSYISPGYVVDRYQQFFYFLVKVKWRSAFGVRHDDLTEKERKTYGTNTGVIVRVVFRNTPAFYANILRDDIITKVKDKRIYGSEDFIKTLDEINDKVDVTILRNGKIKKLQVHLKDKQKGNPVSK